MSAEDFWNNTEMGSMKYCEKKKTFPIFTLSTTILTWNDMKSNMVHRRTCPATTCPFQGTVDCVKSIERLLFPFFVVETNNNNTHEKTRLLPELSQISCPRSRSAAPACSPADRSEKSRHFSAVKNSCGSLLQQ